MKLYHFAPSHLIEKITKCGLTLGRLPICKENGSYNLIGPCQWLTSNHNFDKQSWNTNSLINYDRTAFRLTIVIPKTARKHLINAHEYLPLMPESARGLIEGWNGSENWYLFFGKIPSGWIREIEEREK